MNETVTINGQVLTPKEVNQALKEFKNDDSRIQAMEGICECGAVKERKPNGFYDTCWACYDSPPENYE
jgi:hypothetical protein